MVCCCCEFFLQSDPQQQDVTVDEQPTSNADTTTTNSNTGFPGFDGDMQQSLQPLMGFLNQNGVMMPSDHIPGMMGNGHHQGNGDARGGDDTAAIINSVMGAIGAAFTNGQQVAQQVLNNNSTDVGEAIKSAVNAAVATANSTLHVLEQQNPNCVGSIINQTLDDAIRQVGYTLDSSSRGHRQQCSANPCIT
jgi:hypothetical protein